MNQTEYEALMAREPEPDPNFVPIPPYQPLVINITAEAKERADRAVPITDKAKKEINGELQLGHVACEAREQALRGKLIMAVEWDGEDVAAITRDVEEAIAKQRAKYHVGDEEE